MTAQEALELSYIPFNRILNDITVQARNYKTCLPYVMVSPEDVIKLRELGYAVSENVGMSGEQCTIHWGKKYVNTK